MSDTADALVVLTTLEKQEDGERLARLLIESELAACIQILPQMISIYRWQGTIEHASEVLLLIKTTRAAYQRVETTIKENHPYKTPEIIALSIEAGSNDYLSWLAASVKTPF
ncbi:MAG TPA: divalent-cation tolerance protein CutA [Blastocatellia bacterium]|jgi:periplasmic divalent cation tolerance protein|nr:divalent-cation tolerance protein CutA [Blastocatellia bacterium]